MLLVKQADGEMFHATAAENRQSILRHGLDWRQQIGTAPGIAGNREPELEAVFLCESHEEIGFFTRMSRLPADVWAVRVDGLLLATSLFGDAAAALREHRLAALDEHCWSCAALTES